MKKVWLLIVLFVCAGMQSNDGDLDTTFGSSGISTEGSDEDAFTSAIQPDGKIIVAGGSPDLVLSRYASNGSIDPSFGGTGTVTTDAGGNDAIGALIVQPDGKIVALGGNGDMVLARYNPDGSLDTSFGPAGTGIVTTDLGSFGDIVNIAFLRPNGKILACGLGGATTDFALVQYNPDGTLDTSFGPNGTGIVTTNLGGSDSITAAAIQPDGKIVAAGPGGGGYRMVRYNANGLLDTSFGSAGIVTLTTVALQQSSTGLGVGGAVLIQNDGTILVVGRSQSDSSMFAVARYTSSGILDKSFGVKGTATIDAGINLLGLSGALQPDGKIVAVSSSSTHFVIGRFTAAGSPDVTFGNNGFVQTAVTGSNAGCQIHVLPEGKLLVSGGNDFTLARYLIPSLTVSSFARDLRAKFDLIQKTSG